MNRMSRERRTLCQNETINRVRDKHGHPGVVGCKRKSDGTVADLQAVALESVIEKANKIQVAIEKLW